ncbi:non-ribosomal peptide synthetase [Kordia jejudonensis]|uniref:non-ribosomal peptide synthetase n=1 Tax=Kordia jejudonensis TaxID=1348245 RepID=UPI00062944C5|nr:non-ribosomal peptide synthetase [Kordia jejudonensis]
MNAIEQKIVNTYWIDKLAPLHKVNDQSFAVQTLVGSPLTSDQLRYFNKLTNGNEMAELTVLLAIFNGLLSRYFETATLVCSATIHEKKAVLFHTLDPSNNTLKAYIQAVKGEVQTVYKYKNYTDEILLDNAFETYTPFGFFMHNKHPNTKFPFSIELKKNKEEINYSLYYDEKFISKYTARHFLENFTNWVLNLETLLHEEIDTISILSKTEKNKICYDFNTATLDLKLDETVVQLFENQVKKTPEAIALQHEETSISYEELNAEANQLANYLITTYNISNGNFIGVKLERTASLIISLLAVLKTGAAYVPIDVQYPKERIEYIENDSNCSLVIDEKIYQEFLAEKAKHSGTNIHAQQHRNDLAYIIYTSGTTGKPKGVMIRHFNVSAMLCWAVKEFKNETIEVVYAVTSHCFDLSIFEIFYSLVSGKKVKLLQNALDIGANLKQDKNVLINTVPSSMRAILNEGHNLENVTAINLAGEAFPVDIAEKLIKTTAVVRNLYGPSEDTTYSTQYKLQAKKYNTVPIGKAIANSQAYILDKHMQPVPIGVSGKLYLGGLGVTKGYLNQPVLTAEKFIKNPFKEDEYIYDTGDMAAWRSDGNILFLGRKDAQVKLRGYRIELGEIETAIRAFSEAIQEVVVLVHAETLIAYIVAKTTIDTEMIQASLQKSLPSYMIPNQFICVKKIPLTPNGKIDTKKLTTVSETNLAKAEYIAPKTPLEKALVAIWEEVLGVENIGTTNTFFELGGHSLVVGQVINKIYKQLGKSITVKSFLETPTIAEIQHKLVAKAFMPIPKVALGETYPLTTAQKRIWVLSQFETGNKAYNISGVVKLSGTVESTRIRKAFEYLSVQHEILRTVFKTDETGDVYQHILPTTSIAVDFEEKILYNRDEKTIKEAIQEAQNKVFNLENGPLLSIRLLKISETESLLALTIHHIISDGWSLELLISEFTKVYNALCEQKTLVPNELKIQYKDYAVWLQSELKKDTYKTSETYWLSQFQGELPVLNLPTFKKRPAVQTNTGKTKQYEFPSAFLKKLKTFSVANNATLFMTLLSGINTLFYRYTKQEDIIIGTPVAGRMHPDVETQLGLFLNTLAIRTQLNADNNFTEILAHQKERLIAAYEHQNYPFDELVTKLHLNIDTSRSALFDVMVVLQNHQQLQSIQPTTKLQGVTIERYATARQTSQFDISFTFVETENLAVEVEFNTDIYDELLIDQMVLHYEQLMQVAIKNTAQKISTLDYSTEAEKATILNTFNATTEAREENTVIQLFENQAEKTPNRVALRSEEHSLTYVELNEEANRLANYLRQTHAIQTHDFVGVHIERNTQIIIAILGILKTGAAYVPIDTAYPKDRVAYIQKDSNCKCVINAASMSEFEAIKHQFSTANSTFTPTENQLAYIIYTSGTTGNPKGVMIAQHSFSDYVTTFKNHFKLTQDDKIIQQASIAFDTSIEEIFPILVSGGELIIQKDRNDLNELLETCEKQQITILSTNPSVLQFLNENHTEYNLNFRIIISGGDLLKPSQINNIQSQFDIYNTYGPTESTVCATYHKIDALQESFPIGKPITNRKVYIVDPISNQLQPIGIAGELCISGTGLAVGYLGRENLTNEKFIENPFEIGTKLYKTGDLARWLPNGSIDFLGRIDRQVKLRGYRIELGEIEHTISTFDKNITNVVVTITEINSEKALVVYFTATKAIAKAELKAYIQQKLPAYMVPGLYVHLDEFPITANGKINYKALPEVSVHDIIRKKYIAPQNEVEVKLVHIWETILGIEHIGITDNFFELGGHSMKVIQLGNTIQKEFGYKMKIKDLYDTPNIQHLAVLINEERNTNSEEVVDRIII